MCSERTAAQRRRDESSHESRWIFQVSDSRVTFRNLIVISGRNIVCAESEWDSFHCPWRKHDKKVKAWNFSDHKAFLPKPDYREELDGYRFIVAKSSWCLCFDLPLTLFVFSSFSFLLPRSLPRRIMERLQLSALSGACKHTPRLFFFFFLSLKAIQRRASSFGIRCSQSGILVLHGLSCSIIHLESDQSWRRNKFGSAAAAAAATEEHCSPTTTQNVTSPVCGFLRDVAPCRWFDEISRVYFYELWTKHIKNIPREQTKQICLVKTKTPGRHSKLCLISRFSFLFSFFFF